MGVGYGLSPCAPLILITGYAATLTVGHAVVLGFVFALMSMLSPMLMMLVLSGVLGTRLRREIPHYLVWFQLGCYIVLIAIFSYALVKEVMGL
jgi:xanthosine utilization system XapX-like protein